MLKICVCQTSFPDREHQIIIEHPIFSAGIPNWVSTMTAVISMNKLSHLTSNTECIKEGKT